MSIPFLLTDALQDAILCLSRQPDIRSISCPLDEFELWRGLLKEQVRRAQQLGLPPQEALCLIGPESGIPGITPTRKFIFTDVTLPLAPDPRTGGCVPDRFGGEIHIPYEGTCEADLFILPQWHNVFPERLARPNPQFRYLLGSKRCNHLLTNRDLGELPCATRSDFAGWFLYRNTAPYPDCNPFHETHSVREAH